MQIINFNFQKLTLNKNKFIMLIWNIIYVFQFLLNEYNIKIVISGWTKRIRPLLLNM